MVIGIDIDETITRNPNFFSVLSEALIAAGQDVIIITFREDIQSTEKALKDWGIGYTKLVTSTLEQHLEFGVNEWKNRVCQEHSVDVFIEDSPEVLKHMDPSILSLMVVDPSRYDLTKLIE